MLYAQLYALSLYGQWALPYYVYFRDFNNMNSLNFNIDNGYLEGLVRGFKAGILKQSDYANLVQCETLEGK